MRPAQPTKPDAPPEGPAPGTDHDARRAAFIEAEVERALAMWKGLLPPDVLDAFRERTAVFLMTDPVMVRAIDAAVPRMGAEASEIRAESAPAGAGTAPSQGAPPRTAGGQGENEP